MVLNVAAAAPGNDAETSLADTSVAVIERLRGRRMDQASLDCTWLDGIDVRTNSWSAGSSLAVVLISEDSQCTEDLSVAVWACILKPFTLTGLLSVVRVAIDGDVPPEPGAHATKRLQATQRSIMTVAAHG